MNRFSEITDTKLFIELSMKVEPLCDNGIPTCCIFIGEEVVFDGPMDKPTTVYKKIDLLDTIMISVEMKNKIYDQYLETALHITSIMIDDVEIKDHLASIVDYENDHNRKESGTYIGYNGTWKVEFPDLFYRWWHQETGQGWLLSGTRSISLD